MSMLNKILLLTNNLLVIILFAILADLLLQSLELFIMMVILLNFGMIDMKMGNVLLKLYLYLILLNYLLLKFLIKVSMLLDTMVSTVDLFAKVINFLNYFLKIILKLETVLILGETEFVSSLDTTL